jgi:hypothetical protein
MRSMYLVYSRIGCLVSVLSDLWNCRKSLGLCGGPAISDARCRPSKEDQDKTIVLEDKGRELKTTDHTVAVGVIHILVVELNTLFLEVM